MRYQYSTDQRQEEEALAQEVQAAKAELEQVLGETPRRVRDVEAAAREFENVPAVGKVLRRYEQAVNRLWLLAENSGLTRSIVSAWMKAHRRSLGGLLREDLDAEATLAMRGVIASYKPGQGATLRTYAYRTIHRRLAEVRGDHLSGGTHVGHDRRTLIHSKTVSHEARGDQE